MSQTKWLGVSALIIILDQLTKVVAKTYLVYGDPKPIFGLLNMTLVFNSGASFGFLSSQPGWQRLFFIVFAIVLSLGIIGWLLTLSSREHLCSLALSLIIGGAIGNLLDRIISGMVTDFIQVHWYSHYFPVFNVADMAISLGVMALIWLWCRPTSCTAA